MAIELVVEPDDLDQQYKHRPDHILQGFFRFDNSSRKFSNAAVLADCALFNLWITFYMRDWPGKLHPGIFEEFFPVILERLIEPDSVLTLFINDSTGQYFDAREHVEAQLIPRGLPYVFLPNDESVQAGSQDAHNYLVFQWPLDSLDYVLEAHWLHYGPFVETEGYVSKAPLLDAIAH